MILLDTKIVEAFPDGYLVCSVCRKYEHHHFTFCQSCLSPLTREKEMTWREFIAEQAPEGAGPINTFYSLLSKKAGVTIFEELPARYKKQYEEAGEVYEKNKDNKSKSVNSRFYESKGKKAFKLQFRLGDFVVDFYALRDYAEHVYNRRVSNLKLTVKEVQFLEKERQRLHSLVLESAGLRKNDSDERTARFEAGLAQYLERRVSEAEKLHSKTFKEVEEEIMTHIYGRDWQTRRQKL